jgi:hypothetical protein
MGNRKISMGDKHLYVVESLHSRQVDIRRYNVPLGRHYGY